MKAHIFAMLLVLPPFWAGPLGAQSESSFGCSALQSAGVAAVEGEGGTFYRVQSDLRLRQPIEPQVIAQIASLSQKLAAGGTTLIYVPVPTKAQAMPNLLPSAVANLRYESETAALIYTDVLGEFARQGVLTPDLVAAFAGADEPPFFQSDFHWTSGGAALAAAAIAKIIKAAPSYAQMQTAPYATSTGERAAAFSTLRRGLQIFCTQDLPKVEGLVHTTTKVTTELAASDIFADSTSPQIVLVGTSFSDAPLANFAGALSQSTGLDVLNYGITGGNQFGAITSYLISDDFAAQNPRFLIWENPIYNNLAQFGPDPMAELIAAASASCTQILDAKISGTHRLTADLTGVPLAADDTIFANLGNSNAREATFELTTQSGIARRSVMLRGDRVQSSGRFYKPLGTLWHADFQTLSVTFDQPVTAGSQLALCHTKKDAL
jgi:alginate biosynthesis protein AlgX